MRAPSPQKKIVSRTRVVSLARSYKAQGLRVGVMSGSFDVLTAYHFKVLEECSKKCDVLFILLNSDVSVRGYKGAGKPILSESERAYTLAQSPYVAHVTLFDELTPVSLLAHIQPEVFINVGEWGSDCVEQKTIAAYGGKIVIGNVSTPPSWLTSTTALIARIADSEAKQVGHAIFLDRDGIINENKDGYLYRYEDVTFVPHLIPSLRAYMKAGYKLIIVTNQSGIARGYYTEKQMHTLHRKMRAYLKERGVTIDAIYYCPHGPNDGCDCRKPGIGMLLKAAREQNLNLSKSWFIGDSSTDVEAGRHANVRTVYVGAEAAYPAAAVRPNHFVTNLKEAQKRILT